MSKRPPLHLWTFVQPKWVSCKRPLNRAPTLRPAPTDTTFELPWTVFSKDRLLCLNTALQLEFGYSEVLPGRLRYLLVLFGTFMYFLVLWSTFRQYRGCSLRLFPAEWKSFVLDPSLLSELFDYSVRWESLQQRGTDCSDKLLQKSQHSIHFPGNSKNNRK